jgi:hypothetical protein
MIRVVIQQSIAGHADERYGLGDFSFRPAQRVDIDDDLAAAWFASGVAVSKEDIDAQEPPPPEPEVPEPPPPPVPASEEESEEQEAPEEAVAPHKAAHKKTPARAGR